MPMTSHALHAAYTDSHTLSKSSAGKVLSILK